MNIPEHDWKILRQLHQIALQRFCERVLQEYREVLQREVQSPHDRFLDLVELTHVRQRDIADAFDDLRRSKALDRLIAMRRLGVVTDDEIARLSPETRASLDRFPAS